MPLHFFLCLGVNVFIKVNPNSFCGTKASAPRRQEKPAVRERRTNGISDLGSLSRLKINYPLHLFAPLLAEVKPANGSLL